MARYDHLPISRAAFDLAVHIEQIVRQFSRYHKYTIGTELRACSRHALRLIIIANSQRGATRKATLLRLRQELEWFKVLVRLCHESNAFTTTKAYLYVSEQIVSLAKQHEGWLKARPQRDAEPEPPSFDEHDSGIEPELPFCHPAD
jgi:hypothetical protein